jgi:lipopolysaccharide export LptBFGC system permease protein LptF
LIDFLREIKSGKRRFPRQQTRQVVRDVVWQVGLVLLLIESVFVAEKLLSGLLVELLAASASLGKSLFLMAALMPAVFELALPAALLIAVYRVALGMREDREFLVLSSAGIPPYGLIRLILKIGLGAQIVALLVSGLIEPLSRFAFREVMFVAQYSALAGGTITNTRLIDTKVGTVWASPRDDQPGNPRLFVRQEPQAGQERIVVANGARLSDPDATGRVSLRLFDFSVDDFVVPPSSFVPAGRAVRPMSAPVSSLRGQSTSQSMLINDIIALHPRGRDVEELTTIELFWSAGADRGHLMALGKRLARSLLCLLAPLIALIALSWTTRANQAFVLPLACAGLMATEILGNAALAGLGGLSLISTLAVLVAIAAGLTLTLAAIVASRSSAIARPGLGRS